MEGKTTLRHLQSDSSGIGWAGKDLSTGTSLHEYWRDQQGLHINIKELHAALQSIKALAKRKEIVHIGVDNTVAYSYIKKSGGRKQTFNALMRPFLQWCSENQITVKVNLVKSKEMQADSPSRLQPDKGDYTLSRNVFLKVLNIFAPFITTTLDIFASPGNAHLANWVARHPHPGAWVCNALERI